MTASAYSYDVHCYELAQYFRPNAPEAKLEELAQVIQCAIEDWESEQNDEGEQS